MPNLYHLAAPRASQTYSDQFPCCGMAHCDAERVHGLHAVAVDKVSNIKVISAEAPGPAAKPLDIAQSITTLLPILISTHVTSSWCPFHLNNASAHLHGKRNLSWQVFPLFCLIIAPIDYFFLSKLMLKEFIPVLFRSTNFVFFDSSLVLVMVEKWKFKGGRCL